VGGAGLGAKTAHARARQVGRIATERMAIESYRERHQDISELTVTQGVKMVGVGRSEALRERSELSAQALVHTYTSHVLWFVMVARGVASKKKRLLL